MRTWTPGEVLIFIGVGLLVAVTVVTSVAAMLIGWIIGSPPKHLGVGAALQSLSDSPAVAFGIPNLPIGVFWVINALALLAIGGMALAVLSRFKKRKTSIDHVKGLATSADLKKAAGVRAVLKTSKRLRASIENPTIEDVGIYLGRVGRTELYATVEDSIILLGPPRSGKGVSNIIGLILDAPGAVVTTSTRLDNLKHTIDIRSQKGPVAIFDPQDMTRGQVNSTMRWSLVRGCEDPYTALVRANGLAADTGLGGGGTSDGNFWQGLTQSVISGMLHAAALEGLSARELYRWSLSPVAAQEAADILRSHPHAASGWADSLDGHLSRDPRTRDSMWAGVGQAFASLADPRVMDAVTPSPDEVFDPEQFIKDQGTLYLVGTAAGAAASGSLVAAFIEDLTETARRLAAQMPSARLDPPLSLILDEIGNLAPLPSLPALMSEGGGSGISTLMVLQSLNQARDKWGEQTAGTLWDAAIVKLILGGSTDARDLQDLAALIGERDEETTSISYSRDAGRSTSTSIRRVPIMSSDDIRTLPKGRALLMLRSTKPAVIRQRPWWERKDGKQIETHHDAMERTLPKL